jgi:hypothetical protein
LAPPAAPDRFGGADQATKRRSGDQWRWLAGDRYRIVMKADLKETFQ